MKLFVFENIMGNYCSGDYYFIANSRYEADVMAHNFLAKHNYNVKQNENYIIEWDENIKEYDIEPGFFPINRMSIYMNKY